MLQEKTSGIVVTCCHVSDPADLRHVALLKDEDPNLRCAAAEALGEASKLKELEELGGRPLAQFLFLGSGRCWLFFPHPVHP